MSEFRVQRRASALVVAAFAALSMLGASLGISSPAAAQCVSLTTSGVAVNQSFNTLSSTAASTTNNLTITGWFLTETGGGIRDNEQYAVDTGGSNTGDTYSYGAAGNAERALGGLQSGTLIPVFGACFTNNTGGTISNLAIAYTGEQWRLGAVSRTDRIDFQLSLNATSLATGTWTDVNALDFTAPVTAGTLGGLDGNAAANRTAISSTIPALSIANGATFWIRWNDSNATGADDGLAADDFSLTPNAGPGLPNLSIDDATVTEGDAGTVSANFTVSLSAPAGPGGVTFDIATADGTATVAGNDYALNSLTGQTIPAGSSTYNFFVTVNGDTTPEANETYSVNVTSVVGATVLPGEGQGTGTIDNDDVAITPIHDIQGPGASSPIVGASVTTRGVVTGVRSNGFYIQEPDASVDADPATSEGIFVFTSAAPPAAAVVGARVQVTGTVTEFVPAADPLQPPLSQLTSPTVVQLSTGNPLPAPVALSAAFPDPAGPHDQLERLEGMRVSVASLTVVAPTQGNVNEANATATSIGVFHGVVTGLARPFREAGIQAPDPAPSGGTIPPIPRFDSNPERIRVDSDVLTGSAAIDVGTGAVVTGLVGPLDYAFRTYTILPDPPAVSPAPVAAGGPTPVAAPVPTASEITVGSFNIERFFDTVNDPAIGEPVLTATAYANRLAKASLSIRDFLRAPDILGLVEVENLATLQDLADQISADALAAAQPDPLYDAFLVEGNDIGGIDVGFLVKTAEVSPGTPRVEVVAVTQEGAAELFVNPDASTELLNDRPALVLEAIVHHPAGGTFPLTAIVNHLRSLNGVNSTAPGSSGWATAGDRVRAKRQEQAESLANLIQVRQTADPAERIVVLGDFNVFEVNDGLGDSLGVIDGTPAPDDETAVPGDGVDLVNPDLDNLFDSVPAAERYSYVFDGNAQSLDHVLVNQPLIAAAASVRLEHPRVDADFPQVARNSTTDALRLSDHDPLVAYIDAAVFGDPCISLATSGMAVSENFNTLATAGTTNDLTLMGWSMIETGGGGRDNDQYAADTGTSNTGDTYSYGPAANSDRALGGLQSGTLIPVFGACFTNNTGGPLTSLGVTYTGEEWRLGTIDRTDRLDFQYSLNATDLATGTWTDVNALDFVTPVTTVAGAKDGNAAANRTLRSATIPALSIANGASFWIRWTDLNAAGADDGLAVDDLAVTPNATPGQPDLSVGNDTVTEGDAGTVTANFMVSLSAPAGPGGVTFDIATADDIATVADNDYVANSLTGQTIPAGSSTFAFNVTVNGDTAVEPNQTFFVNVTSVTGANVLDGQGLGTINNDDVTVTPIHDIQGPGASSPIVGASVTTRGVVTGVRSNGFYIQEPDASVDADPATSEGIFVFTSGAPPAAAVVGARVQVTGTVTEFVPAADPLQPPLSQLTSPTVVQLSTGNPLPAPVALGAAFPDPAGPHDQLERVEGMRVSVASLTVSGATLGTLSEANATSTSNGVFYGVVTGLPRPFREPGIPAPDPAPEGTIPPIPRFDSNPERIRVDSDALLGSAALDVGAGAVVTGLVGPLDYTFRTYTLLPDPPAVSPVPVAAGGPTPTSAAAANAREITVAAYNLQRFYDTVNDPGTSDVVLTAAAYDRRLDKASAGIRNFLQTPDILGIVEAENLQVLQDIAARISADALAAAQPDPEYVAFLQEGNDIGGIDVGFLVKTAEVAAGTPRVEVVAVTQEGLSELFVNPDASTELLNDRPSLVLEAIVHHPNGASFPLITIVNHLRSLNGSNSPAPGASGWATAGARVRAKRQAQADSLADLVQARQTADPTERIILVGDFNAFEFNDGLGDSMGTIEGTPSPDAETAVPGDGVDLVNPDLDNLFDTAPALERYSFVFDGSAQSLDHVLVNQPLIADTTALRLEHPRINADFPDTARNDDSAVRLADHDPVVAYLEVVEFATAALTVTKLEGADPVTAGTNLSYTITLENGGPDAAADPAWSDTLPAGTTFVSLSSPAGWSCLMPPSGGMGMVSCSAASLPMGSAMFTLTVAVDPGVASGTVISNTVMATTTTTGGGDSVTETTTVITAANLEAGKADLADPVTAGTDLGYTITVTNHGPSNAANAAFADTLPGGTTFQSLTAPAGWSCLTPPVGGMGMVSCSIAVLAPGVTATFDLTVQVGAGVAGGTEITNSATASSSTTEGAPGDETGTATTTVAAVPGAPNVSATKQVTGGNLEPGGTVAYTIVLTNTGTVAQPDLAGNELTDILPAGLTLVSASATSGTAAATIATNTVTWSGAIPASGTVTITIQATINTAVPPGTTLTNQAAVVIDTDADGTADGTLMTDDPAAAGATDPTVFTVEAAAFAEIPTLGEWGILLLAGLLGLLGVAKLRQAA